MFCAEFSIYTNPLFTKFLRIVKGLFLKSPLTGARGGASHILTVFGAEPRYFHLIDSKILSKASA